MNSAAMRFIPVDRLEAEGYGQYLHLFQRSGAARRARPAVDRGSGFLGASPPGIASATRAVTASGGAE